MHPVCWLGDLLIHAIFKSVNNLLHFFRLDHVRVVDTDALTMRKYEQASVQLEIFPDLHVALNEVLIDERVHHRVELGRLSSVNLACLHVDIVLISHLHELVDLLFFWLAVRLTVLSLVLDAVGLAHLDVELLRAELGRHDLVLAQMLTSKILRQSLEFIAGLVLVAEDVLANFQVAVLRLQYGDGLGLVDVHDL